MSEQRESQPRPPADREPRHNPTSDELEVEGPNESAPGHEPADEEAGTEPPARAGE